MIENDHVMGVKMTDIISIDKDAFLVEVRKYMDISPVVKEYQDVIALKWPNALMPPELWNTMKQVKELVAVACAAVELAKDKIIKRNDPDGSKGSKFDKAVALAAAVEIVGSMIKFKGVVGSIVNKIWLPLLNVMICFYVGGQPVSWVALAMQILKIVVTE